MTQSPFTFRLWTGPAPLTRGDAAEDVPTLTVHAPSNRRGPAPGIVVLPGGGYGNLADHEGAGYAAWLTELGFTAVVVRYRLGSNGYRHPAMLMDAARAVRLVRHRADALGVDPRRVGIIGSSAGGHLAATLLTHADTGVAGASDPVERESARPDLGILCYPVITMGPDTHEGSRRNLLGETPSPEQIVELSNERHVSPATPPCFVWHTAEDTTVKVENAIAFAAALRTAGVPFELHVYEKGRHGIGLGESIPGHRHRWTADCAAWLREREFLKD